MLHCMWSGETGGAERAVYLLVREQLRDPGLEPAILYAQGRGQYYEESMALGCPVIDAALPDGTSFSAIPRLTEVMRRYPVHHFHSREPLLMLASLRCRHAKRVYTHRGGATEYPVRKRMRHELTGLMVRRGVHGLSGNTAHGCRTAAHLLHLAPERFSVTYNGLDFSLLEPRRQADEVRRELGILDGQFVVGTAANLKAWKRLDRLIVATHALGRPEARVLIVGEGSDRPRLEQVTAELGFESNVLFAGSRRHIGDYLQVMDAFCLPSNCNESFGNAAVEAMGMGVPTIVMSDSPGLVEHIDHDVTGIVAEDDAGITRALAALMDDDGLRTAMGAAGRASMRARYSLAAAAHRYRSLYASLGVTNGFVPGVNEPANLRLAADALSLRIDAVCGEVVTRMRAEGVRAIVLKGPSFAEWLYRDGTRRRYGDVDLLVPPLRAKQAVHVLEGLGFKLNTAGEHPLRDPLRGQTWLREHDGAVVDLHVSLFGARAPLPLIWAVLSSDTEHQRIGGIRGEVLSPPARAMHVALHAAQHGERVDQPREDLRRALAMLDEDTWRQAAEIANRIEATGAFVAGMRLQPQGSKLAARLGLPDAAPLEIMLRAGSPPPLAVGLDAVMRTEGAMGKLRLVGRLAVPTRSWMRAHVPLARKGPGGMLAAYLWRGLHLLSWSGPALTAWLRTRRESQHA